MPKSERFYVHVEASQSDLAESIGLQASSTGAKLSGSAFLRCCVSADGRWQKRFGSPGTLRSAHKAANGFANKFRIFWVDWRVRGRIWVVFHTDCFVPLQRPFAYVLYV